MSKQKALPAGSLVGEIFQARLYKPSQGRVTRQVTCAVVWLAVVLAAWRANVTLYWAGQWQYIVPLIVLVVGFWAGYRLVNYARFADFLIAVEAEMNKVSWPSRGELVRSSIVVIFVIFALAMILFGFDMIWRGLFKFLGILQQ